MRLLIPIAISLLLLPGVAVADGGAAAGPYDEAAERTSLAGSIVERMNIGPMLKGWRNMLARMQSFPSCGDEEKDERIIEAWRTATTRGLDEVKYAAEMRQRLAAAFTNEDLRELVRIYDAPLGRKIAASERKALEYEHPDPDNLAAQMAEMAAVKRRLDANPVRKRALQRVIDATGGEQAQVDILVNINLGIALGAASVAGHGELVMDEEEIIATLDKTRPMLTSFVSAIMLQGVELLFKELDVKDLDAYADLLGSAAGKRYAEFGLATHGALLRGSMMDLGRDFARELKAQRL